MFAIANDRKSLWQWDLNQQLTVAGDCTEVHYLDRGAPSTLTVAVKDGKADIPNILLQKAGRLIVYAYIIDAQDHHTKVCETFGIAPRPKPAEYVYTETEVKTWSNLQSQIGDLGDLATEEKNNLVAAINEAARTGGGGGSTYYVELDGNFPNYTLSETTPLADIAAAYNEERALFCRCSMDVYTATLPLFVPMAESNIWIFSGSGGVADMNMQAQYFTIVVSAQGVVAEDKWLVRADAIVTSISTDSTDREVPSAKCLYDELRKRSLKQATSDTLGGIKADPATADDTQPVRIDGSGKLVTTAGGADISLGIVSATVGQTIKVKAVNEQGMPTAWEAADMASGSSGEVWETLTFDIPENDPVSAATINLPSANIIKACIKISLFGTLENTKFGVMVRTGATTGATFISAEIGDFYTTAQQIRTGAIVLEKKADFWQSIYNTAAIPGNRNTTGALRLIPYNSDYLYIKTSTSNETFYGTVTMDYVIGGSI